MNVDVARATAARACGADGVVDYILDSIQEAAGGGMFSTQVYFDPDTDPGFCMYVKERIADKGFTIYDDVGETFTVAWW